MKEETSGNRERRVEKRNSSPPPSFYLNKVLLFLFFLTFRGQFRSNSGLLILRTVRETPTERESKRHYGMARCGTLTPDRRGRNVRRDLGEQTE